MAEGLPADPPSAGLAGASSALMESWPRGAWNPALGAAESPWEVYAVGWSSPPFGRLSIGTGNLAATYLYGMGRWHIGGGYDFEASGGWTAHNLQLQGSWRANHWLALGLRTRWLIRSLDRSRFRYADTDNPDDPTFWDGTSTGGLTLDLGLWFQPWRWLEVGWWARGVPKVNTGFGDRYAWTPIRSRLGIALHPSPDWDLTLDAEYLTYEDREILAGIFAVFLSEAGTHYYTLGNGTGTFPVDFSGGIRWRTPLPWLTVSVGLRSHAFTLGMAFRDPGVALFGGDYGIALLTGGASDILGPQHQVGLLAGRPIVPRPPDTLSAPPETTVAARETTLTQVMPDRPLPSIAITPSRIDYDSLRATLVQTILNPVVFFIEGSDRVDSSYLPLLDEVRHRLAANPDIKLELAGFYDPTTDGPGETGRSLALRRAIAVRDFLEGGEWLSIHEQLKIATDAAGMAAARNTRAPIDSLAREQLRAENRRVELSTADELLWTWQFYSGKDTLPNTLLAKEAYPILLANPHAELLVSRYFEDRARAELPFNLRARIRRTAGRNYDLAVSASPLLEEPIERERTTLHAGKAEVTIDPGLAYERGRLTVTDAARRIVLSREVRGQEFPWRWDLRDADGNPVPVGSYWVTLTWEVVKDKWRTQVGGPLEVRAAHGEMALRAVVANFPFDDSVGRGDQGIAAYLQREKELLPLGSSPQLEIGGFTDSLGTPTRNRELSEQRARWIAARLKALGESLKPSATRGFSSGLPPAEWPTLDFTLPGDRAFRQEAARRGEVLLRVKW